MQPRRCLTALAVIALTVAGMQAVAVPAKASGTTYYIDSGPLGSDANAGTSPSAPWRTLGKVGDNASPVTNGDTILLRRGSVWNDSIQVNDDGITIDAYDSGPLPKIDSSVPVTGWTLVSLDVYRSPPISVPVPFRDGLGNISENGVMMTLADPAGANGSVADLVLAPNRSYTHDDVTDVIYIKTNQNPNAAGMSYRASTLLYGIIAKQNTGGDRLNVHVSNIEVTRVSQHGIQFHSCRSCSVTDSVFSNLGGAVLTNTPRTYAGNAVEFSGRSDNGLAEDLTISQIFDSGISPQVFDTASPVSGITIRNSTIDRAGFAGIEVNAITGPVDDVHISDVAITNSGRGWSGVRYADKGGFPIGPKGNGILFAANGSGSMNQSGLTTSSVVRTTVTNSVNEGIKVEGETGFVTFNRVRSSANNVGLFAYGDQGQVDSLRIKVTSSIFDNNTTAGVSYDAANGDGIELLHNTLYKNGPRNLVILGQSQLADIRNNIFASESDVSQLYVENYKQSNRQDLLDAVTLNNNCYTQTDPLQLLASNYMIHYKAGGGTDYKSLTGTGGFTPTTGYEPNGAQQTRTLVLNPTGLKLNADFSLQAGSVCIGIGSTTTGVTTDYAGNAFGSPPSAGAIA